MFVFETNGAGSIPAGDTKSAERRYFYFWSLNMEDRHAKEIAAGLKAVASAIGGLGFSIVMGAIYIGCMIASRH